MLLKSAASGAIRNNHWVLNPVTGIYERTTLLEASRTNTWTASELLDNGAWSKIASTISADATTAPDGALTADKLVEASDTATEHYLIRLSPGGIGDDTIYTASCFAKAAERTEIRMWVGDKAGGASTAFFDLSAGTVGTISGAEGAWITDAGGGWYRCAVAGDTLSGATSPACAVSLSDGSEDITYNGDGSSGAYLWGLQAEIAPTASSYIPTTSVDTRTADSLYIPFTAVPQEMTVYARWFESGSAEISAAAGASDGRIWHIGGSGTTAPRLELFWSTGTVLGTYHIQSGPAVSRGITLAPYVGCLMEARVIVYADGSIRHGGAVDGGTEVVSTRSGTQPLTGAWNAERLYLNGRGSALTSLNAYAHKGGVRAWPGVLTLEQCRTLAGVT